MSLAHALLGLLARTPLHGYELRTAFEAEVASLWTLNYGQLYPALERLEEAGFVERQRVEQDDRPDKKVYSITDAGRAEHRRWLLEPGGTPKLNRDEFALKLLAGRSLSKEELTGLIQQQRQVLLQAMAEWTRAKGLLEPKREPVAFLLAESMLFRLEADLAWLERVQAHVALLTDPAR